MLIPIWALVSGWPFSPRIELGITSSLRFERCSLVKLGDDLLSTPTVVVVVLLIGLRMLVCKRGK